VSYDPTTGNYNQFWMAEREWDNRTSLIVDPPNGQLPALTKEAEARRAAAAAKPRTRGTADGPEDRPLSERCISYGAPRTGANNNSYVQIMQSPDTVVLLQEMIHDARVVPTTNTPHLPAHIRQLHGDPRGRWEGDTLVVDTIGYNDRTWLDLAGHPHTEALRVTERFRRLDTGRMQLEMTFEDSKTYTRPWTISVNVQLMPDTELLEFVCNENEKSSARYIGDAAADKAREVKLAPAVLTRYAGEYNAGPLGILRVTLEGDTLGLIFPTGGARHAIVATSEEDLTILDLGVPIRFLKGAGGDVTHLRLTIVEGDIDAPRVK
jgi:hypothetical protein